MIAHKGVKRRLRSRGVSVDVVGEFNGRKVRAQSFCQIKV